MRPRRRSHWAVEADKVLATLFVNSQEPTRAELKGRVPKPGLFSLPESMRNPRFVFIGF